MKIKQIIFLIVIITTSIFATNISDFINKHKCDQIINKQIYTIYYSYKYKGALCGWTVLYGNKVNAVNIKKKPDFYKNKSIPKKYSTKYSDYTGTGRIWNRGHFIIADADADYSKQSLYLVYDMAQIQPQAAKVNQRTWFKIEKYGRKLAVKFGSIHSISISNYKGATKKLKNNIVIPMGFYRIYYNDKFNFKKCFYYKNNFFTNWRNDKFKNHLINCNKVHL